MNESLSNNWVDLPLDDCVSSMGDGGTPSRSDETNFGGNIPWVVIGDIERLIFDTKEHLTNKGLAFSSARLWDKDTIILSTGATIGKVGIAMVPVSTKQGITGIKLKDSILPIYFYYILLGKKQKIQAWAQGSTFAEIRTPILAKLLLCITKNKEEQQKIATILTSIDMAIEKTEALIQKYQQIKAGLMHDLFTRGIMADGKLRPPREQAPELYQETPIGWIPKDWKPKKLGEIVSFQRGHDIVEADFVDGEYPVVSSGGVIGHHNDYTTEAPNVVIGRKGTIGKVHFIETKFWAHDTSLFTTDFFGNVPLFVYYLCVWLDLGKFGTRSGSPSLNRNDIHPLNVACPEYAEQKRHVTRLTACDHKIQTLNEDLMKLNKIKPGLMQDLLTGKVRVKVDQLETANV